MNIDDARHLTDLFNHKAAHRTLNFKEMTISMDTIQDTRLKVNVRYPEDVAQYLKHFRDTKDPLFQRGTFQFTSGALPEPITFKACGFFVDPLNKMTWWAQLVRFRFFENDKQSELCFDSDFERTDWNSPLNARPGPSLNDMINIMMRTDNKWERVNFLPPRKEVRQALRLVQS